MEDNLYWNRGGHGLKFGYRYVRRLTSPFTNTDTRSTLNFNRNFTNDPRTNTQGTGLATLLIGYSTGGSRGFLIMPYYMTNQDHALFIQDDWKVSNRLTLNLGLRYDWIFEAFYKGATPQGGLVRGTGIGLSVVQEFVLAHGGSIENVDGEFPGAHIRLRLPLSPAADEGARGSG